MKFKFNAALLLLWVLTACTTTPEPVVSQAAEETARLNQWLDEQFDADVARSPQWASRLGLKTGYDKLDDESEAFRQQQLMLAQERLKTLETFKFDLLDEQARLSYELYKRKNQWAVDGYAFRNHGFPVNQMFGEHAEFPVFMMNVHRLDQVSDADAYVARLKAFPVQMQQTMTRMQEQEKAGIIPPRFVFDKVIQDCENIIKGQPFGGKGESLLLADISRKVAALKDVSEADKKRLTDAANTALRDDVGPAYRNLISYLKKLHKKAPTQVGAWTLPDGEAYYRQRLQRITTTKMTAEDIHQLGLAEVKRIHGEMAAIQKQVGFKGSLLGFFDHMRKSPQFYYSNDLKGRAAYMKEAQGIIAQMKADLPRLFGILPQDDLEVRPVEAFREKSAGIAFYEAPALDGSRPGIYYVNLFDLKQVPRYEIEALAYHEAVPGHHMQISIAQRLEGLPKFRRFSDYTAYSEGWGLYSERLGKEIGLYRDPYSDFGRLSMELMRAVRLVVDTGIHAKKWSRERAIDYMVTQSPSGRGEAVKEIERYIVMPGQATAYMIGKNHLVMLREYAQKELGEKFDVRQFHDQVLKNGPLPLDVLEHQIKNWVLVQNGKLPAPDEGKNGEKPAH